MLGGSALQIPAIQAAKDMGHYVILVDYLEDNPGREYADEYYNVSTTDKEAVLLLAQSVQIDGVVCYATDPAAPTAAYIGEKLNLPSQPLKAVEILSNKDLFRQFQVENNFCVPKAKGYDSYEEAKLDFPNFKLPVMIKPVDSSGSKGVSKLDSIELLKEKVEYALSFSRAKRFIIEEYIQKHGYHVGGDGFSVDGKLIFRSFANEYFPEDSQHINQFVPVGSSWPCFMTERIQEKIHNELQRMITLLNMRSGAYNFDVRVDKNEDVYIIELGARNGGDMYPQLIQYVTGVNLVDYTIKASLGEDCNDLTMSHPKRYLAMYLLFSKNKGIFQGVNLEDGLKKDNLIEMILQVNQGDSVNALTGANEKVGYIILEFSSQEEMIKKLDAIDQYVEVKVIPTNCLEKII